MPESKTRRRWEAVRTEIRLLVGLAVILACQPLYLVAEPAACTRPISYRIGEIDPEFRLSSTTVRSIAAAAARMWEQGTGGKRFVEARDGLIEIRLKYSTRQDLVEARALLEEQAQLVNESVNQFNGKQTRLLAKVKALNKEMQDYSIENRAHDRDVGRYNAEGKHRPEYIKHLKRQREFLKDWGARIWKQRVALSNDLAKANLDRDAVSQQIDGYKQDSGTINELLARMPDYEKLGEYRASGGSYSITLYVYRDTDQLTTLLAHEFGHALGIQHVAVPASLMYPRETEDNTGLKVLHSEDLRAYRQICGGKGARPSGNYF